MADTGTTGNWSVDYTDMAILSTDGTVTPVFNGQQVSIVPAYGGATNLSASVVTDASLGQQARFYLDDHLGTTQMELSTGGWPVWQGWFTPFGQEIGQLPAPVIQRNADGTDMRYKFTGKERDSESGLDYFGARYYGSSIGRFMSPDPTIISRELANPQSWNMYSYTFNNPLAMVDPDGKWPTWFHERLDRNYFGNELHFSAHDQDVIVNQSAEQDSLWSGQLPSNSVWHDMRNGFTGWNAASANAATSAYISSEISSAVEAQLYSEWSAQHSQSDGPISYGHDQALIHLANAEHAEQDSTSPEHAGKPWYGMIPWLAGKHYLDERQSSLASDGMSENRRQEAAYLTRVLYSQYQKRLDAVRKQRTSPNGTLTDPFSWFH